MYLPFSIVRVRIYFGLIANTAVDLTFDWNQFEKGALERKNRCRINERVKYPIWRTSFDLLLWCRHCFEYSPCSFLFLRRLWYWQMLKHSSVPPFLHFHCNLILLTILNVSLFLRQRRRKQKPKQKQMSSIRCNNCWWWHLANIFHNLLCTLLCRQTSAKRKKRNTNSNRGTHCQLQ